MLSYFFLSIKYCSSFIWTKYMIKFFKFNVCITLDLLVFFSFKLNFYVSKNEQVSLISLSSTNKNVEIVRLDITIGVQTPVPPLCVCEFKMLLPSLLSTKKNEQVSPLIIIIFVKKKKRSFFSSNFVKKVFA